MAGSVDLAADLDEFVDTDELTENFTNAANHLQTLIPNIDRDMLLQLYAYYKQGTDGPCNAPKPSWYDMKAKAKWEAWNKLGALSSDDAKTEYIRVIQKIDPSFSPFSKPSSGNKEGWVTVSTLQSNDVSISDANKSVTDYIKEANVQKVGRVLETHKQNELEEILAKIDEDGLGLIHWAADRGSLDILQILLKFGADVNLRDSELQTALHYAVSCGYVDCVALLLENGADITAKDSDGVDALASASDDKIKQLLCKGL